MKLPAIRSALPAVLPAVVRAAWRDTRALDLRDVREWVRERAAAISSCLFPHSGPIPSSQDEFTFAEFPAGRSSFTSEALRATLVLVGTVVALLVGTLPALWWAIALQYLDALN